MLNIVKGLLQLAPGLMVLSLLTITKVSIQQALPLSGPVPTVINHVSRQLPLIRLHGEQPGLGSPEERVKVTAGRIMTASLVRLETPKKNIIK